MGFYGLIVLVAALSALYAVSSSSQLYNSSTAAYSQFRYYSTTMKLAPFGWASPGILGNESQAECLADAVTGLSASAESDGLSIASYNSVLIVDTAHTPVLGVAVRTNC